MSPIFLCVAVTALGIDAGWQRMPDGGMEYIIQLTPQDLEAMRRGEPLGSDVPPAAGDVRSYRVVFGSGPVRKDTPAEPKMPLKPSTASASGAKTTPSLSSTAPPALTPEPAAKQMAAATLSPPRLEPTERTDTVFRPKLPSDKPATGQSVVFEEPKGRGDSPAPAKPHVDVPSEASRPWMPLTATLLTLFASLGGNVFLGWIAWGFRQRYIDYTAQRSVSLPA